MVRVTTEVEVRSVEFVVEWEGTWGDPRTYHYDSRDPAYDGPDFSITGIYLWCEWDDYGEDATNVEKVLDRNVHDAIHDEAWRKLVGGSYAAVR